MNTKTFIRLQMRDGNFFELPAPDNTSVAQFMAIAKGLGCVATNDIFLNYSDIMWAARVVYQDILKVPSVGGMEPAGSA